MRYLVAVIIMVLFLGFSNVSQAVAPDMDLSDYYIHGEEATRLALKIDKLKDKYYLEYKDFNDLIETCKIIVKYDPYTKFDKYDVSTIILKEARFNKNAVNKKDGGKGLGQLTGIETWHKDTLFWLKDPFNKDQNIRGILIVLEENRRMYGSKYEAIKRYNGSNKKAEKYRNDFYNIRSQIKAVKI